MDPPIPPPPVPPPTGNRKHGILQTSASVGNYEIEGAVVQPPSEYGSTGRPSRSRHIQTRTHHHGQHHGQQQQPQHPAHSGTSVSVTYEYGICINIPSVRKWARCEKSFRKNTRNCPNTVYLQK